MRFKWTVVRLGLVAMLAFALQAIPAFAQGQASLAGYVSDPTGAMIPGAQVSITNDATNVSRKVQSDAQGHYFVSPLDPGTYTVTARAKGFQTTRQTGVVISVATQEALNLKMNVGSNSETVTVAADAAHVQTETGQVSYTISGKQVQDIAVNGRNFVSLAVLVPGASSELPGEPGVGVTGGVPIRFNGVRSGGNLWTIDGSPNQDVGSQNSLNTYPAIDAIDEFTTLTSNYSAAYGNAGGSVIAMALKSGTNQFHGTAYEYLRNDALDARNAFLSSKSPLKQNDFGFTIGGPIRKNKDFFFFSEEIRRLRQGTTVSTMVPTSAELGGDFSDWAGVKGTTLSPASLPASLQNCIVNNGTGIDPNCINPNAKALMNAGVFPGANTTTAWGNNNFNAAPSVPSNFHEELFRIDHHFSDSMSLMGHYIHDSFDQTPATSLWAGDSFPTVTNTIITPGHNLVLDLTRIVSPTIVNDLNFSFTEDNISIINDGLYQRPSGFTAQELYPGNTQNRIPDLNFSQGYGSYQVGPRPWYNNNAIYTWSDKVTQTVGRNTFQYGGDFQYQIKNQDTSGNTQGGYNFSGQYTGNAFADYLLGLPNSYTEANRQFTGLYRYEQLEGFVQDDIKVSPRLTLNLGLRWFLIPHTYDKLNQLSNFVPADYNSALAPTLDSSGNIVPGSGDLMNGLIIAGTNGLPRGLTQTYYNNWAPRLGFSWDPFGAGTTVVRGGYSVGYYRVQGNDIYNISGNPPFSTTVTVSNPQQTSATFFDNPAGGAAAPLAPPNLNTLSLQYKVPMIQQYSLTLQHQFAGNIIASVGYVGSHGTHLEHQLDGNQPLPFIQNGVTYDFNPALNGAGGPGVGGSTPSTNLFRPYLGWGSMTETATDASSEYNSLQVSAQKQMTKNLSFQVAYTWSKSMDNASDFGGAHPQNSHNRASEWAVSTFDRPQILQINYIYDLPFYRGQQGLLGEALGGWELAGITTMESGEPLTIGLSSPGTGLATRPNITGAVSTPKTVAEWFNTSVFSLPSAGMFGTAGRDIVRGPGMQTWNLSLYKNFKVGERVNTQLRFEFFNIFNHTNYTSVSTNLGSGNFGQVTASADPRILQAGLHISF